MATEVTTRASVKTTGRGWAYTGALLGGAVSVAANVAHSYVPPADAPAGWRPHGGAVVGAVFWPFALFVAVEIFARISWPAGRRWTALRFLGLLPVALVAAVVSYRHLSGLLAFYHEDGLTAVIGPLAVDGLMVMATGALIATATRRAAVTEPVTAPAAERSAEPVPMADPPATATSAAESPADATATATTAVKPAVKPTRPKVTRRPASADKVAKVAARMPGATVAAIAAKAGVSESTARRYLPDRTAPAADATVASAIPVRPAETPTLTDAAPVPVAA
jgi:lambda repressor-like predicted transcriptional regulator